MELADFDAVFSQRADGVLRFLKFDSEMAGVVIDTEMFVEAGVIRMCDAELVKEAKAVTSDRDWAAFAKKFRTEMNGGDASKVLDLLAALSKTTNFSVGCYCEDESRCHRSILRQLLDERGALIR